MPQFPKPKFAYAFDTVAEIARLQQHKQIRGIPAKAQNRLLLATWNIANFGAQERQDKHLMLIAEMLKWFDVIAIQDGGRSSRKRFTRFEPARLITEGRSRNTHENAVFAKELVEPKAGEVWLLITSAAHMPRAVGVFRKRDGMSFRIRRTIALRPPTASMTPSIVAKFQLLDIALRRDRE